jgi:hypothetical protein
MRRALLVIVVVVVMAGCGGSDDAASSSPEGKKLVAALLTSYRSGSAKQAFTPSEARCIAEHAIDAAGTDAIDRSHVTPKDLNHGNSFPTLADKLPAGAVDDVSKAVAEAGCVDIGVVLLRSGVADDPAFARVAKAKVRCLFVTLGAPPAAHRAFADSLLGLPRGDREFNASFRDRATVLRALRRCHIDPTQIQSS